MNHEQENLGEEVVGRKTGDTEPQAEDPMRLESLQQELRKTNDYLKTFYLNYIKKSDECSAEIRQVSSRITKVESRLDFQLVSLKKGHDAALRVLGRQEQHYQNRIQNINNELSQTRPVRVTAEGEYHTNRQHKDLSETRALLERELERIKTEIVSENRDYDIKIKELNPELWSLYDRRDGLQIDLERFEQEYHEDREKFTKKKKIVEAHIWLQEKYGDRERNNTLALEIIDAGESERLVLVIDEFHDLGRRVQRGLAPLLSDHGHFSSEISSHFFDENAAFKKIEELFGPRAVAQITAPTNGSWELDYCRLRDSGELDRLEQIKAQGGTLPDWKSLFRTQFEPIAASEPLLRPVEGKSEHDPTNLLRPSERREDEGER